jgi:hypothetical protein
MCDYIDTCILLPIPFTSSHPPSGREEAVHAEERRDLSQVKRVHAPGLLLVLCDPG